MAHADRRLIPHPVLVGFLGLEADREIKWIEVSWNNIVGQWDFTICYGDRDGGG